MSARRLATRRLMAAIAVCAVACLLASALVPSLRWKAWSMVTRIRGRETVETRLAQYRESARARLAPAFERASAKYPPARCVLVALKDEKTLEVWCAGGDGAMTHIVTYPILAASGGPGPKLREGDKQVPEGVYRIESLNPNSLYHLALRLDYPNAEDRAAAEGEGRTNLGGDIMIHGKAASIGCLAIGDPAIEELFVLAAETGIENVEVLIAPWDLRLKEPPGDERKWVRERYRLLRERLAGLPNDDTSR